MSNCDKRLAKHRDNTIWSKNTYIDNIDTVGTGVAYGEFV